MGKLLKNMIRRFQSVNKARLGTNDKTPLDEHDAFLFGLVGQDEPDVETRFRPGETRVIDGYRCVTDGYRWYRVEKLPDDLGTETEPEPVKEDREITVWGCVNKSNGNDIVSFISCNECAFDYQGRYCELFKTIYKYKRMAVFETSVKQFQKPVMPSSDEIDRLLVTKLDNAKRKQRNTGRLVD